MNFRKTVPAIAMGALVAVLAGCGGGGAAAPASGGGAAKAAAGDAAKGKEIFSGTCFACHGSDAKGLPGLGKNLVNKSDWMKKQDDAALVAFIKTGRPSSSPDNTTHVDMPPKGGNPALTDDDVTNVVAYIRSLQKAAGN